MKIDYQEPLDDLQTRIDIHNQYGGKDIDKWMLEILEPEKGVKILDVGCGAGKLCFSFYDYLNGECEITGGDLSEELLARARQENQHKNASIEFMHLDFNQPFDLPDNAFDLVSCSFAIYYAADIPFTIGEMHRVLKPGGRLFTTGPMPENKHLFYDIIHTATQQPIPPMPGSSRYNSQILSAIKDLFSNVEVEIFENPLTFTSADPFLSYTRASLSEDRRLWKDLFSEMDFETVMQKIALETQKRIDKDAELVMTKVVGGFIATR